MALTFLQAANSGTDLTTYTFATQNLGTAAADRYIIVATAARKAGASTTISSITVGGVSATIVVQRTNNITNTDVGGIAIAAVPTGTTGDVVVTFGAGMVRCGIALWAATGLASDTPSDTDSSVANAPTVNLDIPANGFAVACAFTAAIATTTWAGLTEQYDTTIETVNAWTGSSDTFASVQTGLTITATFTGSPVESVGCFASWALSSPLPFDEDYWQVPIVPGFVPRISAFQDTDDIETISASAVEEEYWRSLSFSIAPTVSRIFSADDDLPVLTVAESYWQNRVLPVIYKVQQLYPSFVEELFTQAIAAGVPEEDYWRNAVAPVAARLRQLSPYDSTEDIASNVVIVIRGRLYAGSLQPNLLVGTLTPNLQVDTLRPSITAETIQ